MNADKCYFKSIFVSPKPVGEEKKRTKKNWLLSGLLNDSDGKTGNVYWNQTRWTCWKIIIVIQMFTEIFFSRNPFPRNRNRKPVVTVGTRFDRSNWLSLSRKRNTQCMFQHGVYLWDLWKAPSFVPRQSHFNTICSSCGSDCLPVSTCVHLADITYYIMLSRYNRERK